MEGVGFVRGGERNGDSTAAAPNQPAAAGSGVVILAPKQSNAGAPADALNSNILGIRRVLKQRAAAASGRAVSPDSPPAGRRRASPTYEGFKPRGSPSYEPAAQPRASPSYEPQPRTATAAGAAADAAGGAAGATAGRNSSRSSSRSRSKSRSRSRSRSPRRSRDKKSRKHRSKHSKRSRSRSRGKDRRRSSRDRRSRSRSRDRHRSSDSRNRRSSKHSSRRRSRSRSRSRSRVRHRSRSRSHGVSLRFSAYERERARAEERTHAAPMRMGKQGLGFGQSTTAAEAAVGHQQQQGREGSRRGSGAGSKAGSVSVLDAAAHIPGYAGMSAAEKMTARMHLVMAKAEQQGAAADAADDASAGAAGRGEAWTRFVFDKHGALDEDKLARQQLMDAEVAAGVAGSSAAVGADVEEAGAAFVMGTGRAAARRAATLRMAEEQHEGAIFGRPYGGSGTSGGGSDGECGGAGEPAAAAAAVSQPAGGEGQLAASLGVADGLLSGQQLSWRERLALKKKQQQ